jgi:predicted small metal-binding protein
MTYRRMAALSLTLTVGLISPTLTSADPGKGSPKPATAAFTLCINAALADVNRDENYALMSQELKALTSIVDDQIDKIQRPQNEAQARAVFKKLVDKARKEHELDRIPRGTIERMLGELIARVPGCRSGGTKG